MYVQHSGALFDDFIGNAILSDRYSIDDTNGTVALVDEGPDKTGGTLALLPGPDITDYVDISTVNLTFTRTGLSRFIAKFRLPKIDNVLIELGFRFDVDNYVVLKVDTDADFEWHFEAAIAGTPDTQDYGQHIDTDWHTVEIRLLGATGGAELIMDNDEANKLTIIDANLPDTPFYLWAHAEMLATFAGQTRDLLVDYLGARQQRDLTQLIQQTAPGGADAVTAMSIYNDLLHIGRGTNAGGAKQRFVQAKEYDGTWTDLGAPSATAGKVSALRNFDGYLYAGHDDEADVFEWSGGTTWANVGTLTGATGCASLERWKNASTLDELYAGTIGNPAKVMLWDYATTWSDISDAGWTSGLAAIMIVVHDGELFAYHGGDGKVYEYSGAGTTWTDRGAPGGTTLSADQSKNIFSFKNDLYAFDPENDYLYKWGGGTTWAQVRLFTTTCSVKQLQTDGFFYYIDTGGLALMRSIDGVTWENFATISGATAPKQLSIGEGAIFIGDDAGNIWVVR